VPQLTIDQTSQQTNSRVHASPLPFRIQDTCPYHAARTSKMSWDFSLGSTMPLSPARLAFSQNSIANLPIEDVLASISGTYEQMFPHAGPSDLFDDLFNENDEYGEYDEFDVLHTPGNYQSKPISLPPPRQRRCTTSSTPSPPTQLRAVRSPRRRAWQRVPYLQRGAGALFEL